MAYCNPCDRSFSSFRAYEQHIDNSSFHRNSNQQSNYYESSSEYESSSSEEEDPGWECDVCDRTFISEHSRHQHYSAASGHPYCVLCKRMFNNENNLNQHLHSKIHMGGSIKCPFCKNAFTTASGVTIHLESGTCTHGNLDRKKINTMIQKLDRNNVITKPLLTMPGHNSVETLATNRAWNGSGYECYFCDREFGTLRALNQHLGSPVHERNLYRCPKGGCGREYKLLSGLVQHVESESCGLMRFGQVQAQARKGIENMVGRMISN